MEQSSRSASLLDLLYKHPRDIHAIACCVDELMNEAIAVLNAQFGPTRLCKRPRLVEPLPTDKRALSSYRTRIGTMLEYALSTEMHRLLVDRHGDFLKLTFVAANEYPDFLLRSDSLSVLLRIEMKAVDAESDEQAARFDAATALIRSDEDLVLLVGWEWAQIVVNDDELGEYPHIFAGVVLPAAELAYERDKRLEITGGRIDGLNVLVQKRDGDGYGPDPGNYGKLWRLVHPTRRAQDALSPSMQRFLKFLEEVDKRSPHSRLSL